MDYKEKYEKVLKKLRGLIKNDSEHVIYEYEILERVPELKESEDERIRKRIIILLKDNGEQHFAKEIAWLEKMGDQKPAKWSEHQHKLLNYAISITADTEVKRFLESLRNTESRESAEWSDKDKNLFEEIKRCVGIQYPLGNPCIFKFLKSLKNRMQQQPQNTWKPSEEQMEALIKFVDTGNTDAIILESLYNDLKKL